MKQIKFSAEGMTKDLSKSKFPSQAYYDGRNIRIVSTDEQSGNAVTNEHGNTKVISIPIPVLDIANRSIKYTGIDGVIKELSYKADGDYPPRCELEEDYTALALVDGFEEPQLVAKKSKSQVIIGKAYTRDNVILFTTDDFGFDCVWELGNVSKDAPLTISLMYMRNLGFSTSNPIQAIYNYENPLIEKVYWVDGKAQLRFLNLRQSLLNGDSENLIEVGKSVVSIVGDFKLSQPKLKSLSPGGKNTAGVIQYGYNLYRVNGSQTVLSPLSPLISLGKITGGGGELNEVVSSTVTVSIKDLDKSYTHIKVYAIKYSSYNQAPSTYVVFDGSIANYDELIISDGGTIVKSISLAELLFLGSNVFIPKHIESKNLRLFMFNLKELKFEIDLDTRAYGHAIDKTAVVWHNVVSDGLGGVTTGSPSKTLFVNTDTYLLDSKHDSINKDYESYKFQKNGNTIGVEGKYIKLEVERTSLTSDELITSKLFKDREIYRIAIEFYNSKGQYSFPKWIADIKMPSGNLDGLHNKLKVTMKPEFYSWLNTISVEKPVGYRLLRSDRTDSDKTILCQGLINGMIANVKEGTDRTYQHAGLIASEINVPEVLKMPSIQRRLGGDNIPFIKAADYHSLSSSYYNSPTLGGQGHALETNSSSSIFGGSKSPCNFQYNRLMQLYSPDITFGNPILNSSMTLNVVGCQKQSVTNNWSAEYNPVTETSEVEAKFLNGFNADSGGVNTILMKGDPQHLMDKGFFAPTNGEGTTAFHQIYREFKGGFIRTPDGGMKTFELYGTPEISESGSQPKAYNNDSLLRYSNSLQGMLLQKGAVQVYGQNSYGARCVVLAEGSNDSKTPISVRRPLEKIFTDAWLNLATGGSGSSLGNINSGMVVELAREKSYEYLGGIYGGNSMESKTRSSYISMGDYNDISINEYLIKSPGDTFVSDFNFAKIAKTDNKLSSVDFGQLTELISVPLETSINLTKRNDTSTNSWDNRFQPKESEYHQYNKVYSQQPTLIQSVGVGLKFKSINEFDTKFISSSVKIPGEFLDSWTNFLDNETRTIDGRYGPITGVAKFADEIYTFQDSGVAKISIEPRVQMNASDGIAIQLGTGKTLDWHTYLSTDSGTKNKWSIITTPSGIYYYDTINRSIMQISSGVKNLTELAGMHSFMTNNTAFEDLSNDNPILLKGVSIGYNNLDNEVYFTFNQRENKFTLALYELKNIFTSFYDYVPSIYICKGQRIMSTGPDKTSIWQHFLGKRNSFYGVTYPSSITFLASPDSDSTFNNVDYRMEMKNIAGEDLPNTTLSSARLWNEYQDTGEVSLILRKNLKRRFRNWNIIMPRAIKDNKRTRDRIRSQWAYLKLTLNNPDGNKMILHDPTLSYTEH